MHPHAKRYMCGLAKVCLQNGGSVSFHRGEFARRIFDMDSFEGSNGDVVISAHEVKGRTQAPLDPVEDALMHALARSVVTAGGKIRFSPEDYAAREFTFDVEHNERKGSVTVSVVESRAGLVLPPPLKTCQCFAEV